MAITDYIPNIFGSAAPSSYESLLGIGLLTPEQVQKQQNVANIQGLLGAGLSLAQGMGATGPRRSAAENILGALAGGFGAAGGAYQQGLQNVVQQQQLQSAALTQQQAANRLKAIQQAAQQNPELAQLFAINPEEATKQMFAMQRAKLYGFGTEGQPTVTPAAMPTSGAPQVAPQAPVTTEAGQVQPQVMPMVNQANVARANTLRKNAIALSFTDKDTAKLLYDEAERLDPKETLFFRDDKLVSSKRGIIGDFSGGKILTDEQATALGLDPNRGKWTMKGGIPSLVGGTEQKTRPLTESEIQTNRLDPNKRYQINQATGNITEIPTTAQAVKLTDEQAQAEGLSIGAGQKYFRLPSGEFKKIEGTGTTKLLTAQEIINNSLDPNKAYQITPNGDISVVTDIGTVANKADLLKVLPTQFTGVYPTLKPSVDALIARAPTMTRDQIVTESEKILSDDANIRKELDPKLAAQRIAERKAGKTDVNVTVADKEFGKGVAGAVAGAVETTYNRAASAQQTISTINNIRPLIKEGVYSGPLSTSNMYIDRLASSLGITSGTINDKLVRTSQAMQGLASLELSAAEAMKGQGAITENERSLIARAAGGNFAQFTAAEVSGLLNALEKTAKSKISAHTKNLERLRKRKDTADLADFYELENTGNLQDAARQELERRRGK